MNSASFRKMKKGKGKKEEEEEEEAKIRLSGRSTFSINYVSWRSMLRKLMTVSVSR